MATRRVSKRRTLPKPDRCPVTGKVRWPDGRAAIEVLHRASRAKQWAEASGAETRRLEVRHYHCGHCHGFHTTSQQEWLCA